MSPARSLEQGILASANALVAQAVWHADAPPEASLEVLEAAAAHSGGWDLEEYRDSFPAEHHIETGPALAWGDKLLGVLEFLPVPFSLALASLAQPALDRVEQRRSGAFYTDFRLARHLALKLAPHVMHGDRVLDPAAGSGALLSALTLAISRGNPSNAARFIAEDVCAADLSATALRATRLALAGTLSGTASLEPLRRLESRLFSGDSLLRTAAQWRAIAPLGFGAVIANPPWEKLKITRHEALVAAGVERHYGSGYGGHDSAMHTTLERERREMTEYLNDVSLAATRQGTGEADLYKLFLDLSARVLRPGGHLALLIPAGLIRSQGTRALREFLVNEASVLDLTVHDNKACYFSIDTRFKFLSMHASFEPGVQEPCIRLQHGVGDALGVTEIDEVQIPRSTLRSLRSDLTIPEVRGVRGWRLFQAMTNGGTTLASGHWRAEYRREVDMTNDRRYFVPGRATGALPVMEGRMLHQFRVHAKAYIGGTGRAATWQPLPMGRGTTVPQFRVASDSLAPQVQERVNRIRAGFCDVTGQTNERTLLAAVVPPGVVCGNKVPTLSLSVPGLTDEESVYLWVALANSLPVDWLARRLVTTSMNYFLLASVPIPITQAEDPRTHLLIRRSRAIVASETSRESSAGQIAKARAEIDSVVAELFNLAPAELGLILEDFPLLDRGQPPLPGEHRSTITRDLVMMEYCRRLGEGDGTWKKRVTRARSVGAVAYVPAEYARAGSARAPTGRK